MIRNLIRLQLTQIIAALLLFVSQWNWETGCTRTSFHYQHFSVHLYPVLFSRNFSFILTAWCSALLKIYTCTSERETRNNGKKISEVNPFWKLSCTLWQNTKQVKWSVKCWITFNLHSKCIFIVRKSDPQALKNALSVKYCYLTS